MKTDKLILEKKDGIGILTINRPDKMNAMTTEMYAGLRALVQEVGQDDSVRVLVVTGSGRAFCAGSDVESRLAPRMADQVVQATRTSMLEPVGYIASFVRALDKPIIGAINGVAVGAGLSLATLCDIRVASEEARFGSGFLRVGLSPDTGASYTLPRLVGIEKALELFFTGEIIGAREAERIGLVSRVVPHDRLMEVSLDLAAKIAQGPPIAISLAKRAVYRSWHNTFDEQLDLETRGIMTCRGTADHAEGVRAFQEKRRPVFQGK